MTPMRATLDDQPVLVLGVVPDSSARPTLYAYGVFDDGKPFAVEWLSLRFEPLAGNAPSPASPGRALADRIAAIAARLGSMVDPLQWGDEMPSIREMLLAARCMGAHGRRLAVYVATRAAWRVLPALEAKIYGDKRPRAALELVDRWLAGEAVSADNLFTAAYGADDAAFCFAPNAPAAAGRCARFAADHDDGAFLCAAEAVRDANYTSDDPVAERAAQRADFLAELDRIEATIAGGAR